MILELAWEIVDESEGGGYKAITPIGDYVVWENGLGGHLRMIYCELWDGPEKQGVVVVSDPPNIKYAKQCCSDHFNHVYREMCKMVKQRPNPADGPMHPKHGRKVA